MNLLSICYRAFNKKIVGSAEFTLHSRQSKSKLHHTSFGFRRKRKKKRSCRKFMRREDFRDKIGLHHKIHKLLMQYRIGKIPIGYFIIPLYHLAAELRISQYSSCLLEGIICHISVNFDG